MKLAVECISTGLGTPILANDEVIIPCLLEFGINEEDAYKYTTSACWEPLIGGKSVGNNNHTPLNYLRALDNLFKRDNLELVRDFDQLIDRYFFYLERNLKAVKRVIKSHIPTRDVLLSVFTYGCYESGKDVSQGGALYNNLGITSVAMGNTINSLLNIKKYVFDEKVYTLYDVKRMITSDYAEDEDALSLLKDTESYYGKDDKKVIALTQKIMDFVSDKLNYVEDGIEKKIKIGLSGSAYMEAARGFAASFDGRKEGAPFVVHISNEGNLAFTEITNFAAKLDYGDNRFNGNVIDLMINPDFINRNQEKFLLFLNGSIQTGFFEMQMNVVSSKDLIEAKKNPDKFPNLIVRVWGFSAYFNDLTEDYKEVLIQRALASEKRLI
ncbi:MAG: hypothetical protein IJ716_09570 [Lachnospiraceae bacterium]|nr:hypothetical protein [Lachnospiraceae bacterium]